MELNRRIAAVVTGGASGLGEATVRLMRSHGVAVALLDFDADRGQRIADELDCMFCQVDVSSEESISAALAQARAANGCERILVNCAGVAMGGRTVRIDPKTGAALPVTASHSAPNFTVNLLGTFICSGQSAAGMIGLDPINDDGERGIIINVGSTEGEDGTAGLAAYAASKGGVLALTLPMARDLQAYGVRVNAIAPGFFRTSATMIGSGPKAEAVHAKLVDQTLFPKRAGIPDEFAKLVQHIIENVYINAANIRIDAGHRLI